MVELRPLFKLEAEAAAPIEIGPTTTGQRRIIPVTGGRFYGDRLNGELLLGGTDIQRIRRDGVADLRIHAPLETVEGDRILLNGRGLRHAPPAIAEQLARGEDPDPSLYYFREAITFETGSPELSWLTRVLAIGSGRRTRDHVYLDVFEVA
ncbi:MAG TPA: DUF3237 domain-containing protein [Caulobacteraceae bacterium]|jgi:hypothetical protein